MADLTEVQSAQAVKIAGANPSNGIENNFLDVDSSGKLTTKLNDGVGTSITSTLIDSSQALDVNISNNNDLKISDGLRDGGVQGALTLATANTAYEAKVNSSRLINRKILTIMALDDMYWGYDNTVTPSTGTPLFKNQSIIFSIDSDSSFQIWLVASSNNKTTRITESP